MENSFTQPSADEIEHIATEGSRIYAKNKAQYEQYKGKFLAIDVENEDIFMADTNSDAVKKAKKQHPDKVFYVVKIGHSATETIASMKSHDQRTYSW